jgi:hypothetical protein
MMGDTLNPTGICEDLSKYRIYGGEIDNEVLVIGRRCNVK